MMKKRVVSVLLTALLVAAFVPVFSQGKPAVKYEVAFQWAHLDWLFNPSQPSSSYKGANGQEYWKGAMPAGFKVDANGNFYLSVPRWAPGIPATFNMVVMKDGQPLLAPFPSWAMNKEGDPKALQSVLGYEINRNRRHTACFHELTMKN